MKKIATRYWQLVGKKHEGLGLSYAPAPRVSRPGIPGEQPAGRKLAALGLTAVLGLVGLGLSGCASSVPAGYVPARDSGVHESPSGKNGVNSGQATHETGGASTADSESGAGGTRGTDSVGNKAERDDADESSRSGAGDAEGKTSGGTNTAPVRYQVSNLADVASRKEVTAALKAALPAKDVDTFMASVKDYNDTIQNTTLTSGFAPAPPQYDLDKIEKLWQGAKGNFIGADCRISAFQLVRTQLKMPPTGSADAALLFQDLDAIKAGKLFNAADTKRFQQLFSRVKTTKTTEVKTHATKMATHFKGFRFPTKARLVTVVINDILDGNNLFVGHVGVLVPAGDKWLFVEKISFQEPYQALKFDTPEDCYRYLADKYRDYADEGAAQPFVMDNGRLVGD